MTRGNMCSGANDDHFPLFFFVSPFPLPPPVAQLVLVVLCHVRSSGRTPRGLGWVHGHNIQWKQKRHVNALSSVGALAFGSPWRKHTRVPNTQHIYMERARKPEGDQFRNASQKERFLYPSISSLFCCHRRLGMPPRLLPLH